MSGRTLQKVVVDLADSTGNAACYLTLRAPLVTQPVKGATRANGVDASTLEGINGNMIGRKIVVWTRRSIKQFWAITPIA